MSKDDKFYGKLFTAIAFGVGLMVMGAVVGELMLWTINWWKGVLM